MTRIINYQNKKFHSLTLIARIRVGGKGVGAIWLAQCDCGNTREVAARQVANGRIKTCGKCPSGRDLARGRRIRTDRTTKEQRKSYKRYLNTPRNANGLAAIPIAQFLELIAENCSYCGALARQSRSGLNEITRVVDSEGFTLQNLEPICRCCKEFKGTHNRIDFLDLCTKVALHQLSD